MDLPRDISRLFEELRKEIEQDDDKQNYDFPCGYGESQTVSLEQGDIIGVDHGIYQHYGIYAGRGWVIHYTAETSDLDAEHGEIQETTLRQFLRCDMRLFVLEYCGLHTQAHNRAARKNSDSADPDQPATTSKDQASEARQGAPYSPEETVERARNRIGERNYNPLTNNAMHFAVWCKTGISDAADARQWVAYCKKIIMGD